jgi:hypothetical protein
MEENKMKKNIKKEIEKIMSFEKTTELMKTVCEDLLDKETDEEIENYIGDILNGGCENGTVSMLIYYSDTAEFYKKHKHEINKMLYEIFENYGSSDPKDLFGGKWDEEDPLVLDIYNQNLLAWFGFEETTREIAEKINLQSISFNND